MNPGASCAVVVAAGVPAPISLTEALLVLTFGGLLVAVYQLNRVLQRLGAIEHRLTSTRPRLDPVVPVAAPTAPAAVASANSEISPHLFAAIAAACHMQLGANARIVSITDAADVKLVWSLEGRRQIFASHRVR